MRAGMVAARSVAELRINDRLHLHAERERLLQHGAMRAHALHRLRAAQHLRHDRVVIVGAQPAVVAHLATGVGVERGVVEHHLHLFAGLCSGHTHAVAHNGQHLAMLRLKLAIAFKHRPGQLAIGRAGAGLGAALPGCAGARLLLRTGRLEAGQIELQALVTCGIHHEVERQTEGLVQVECLNSRIRNSVGASLLRQQRSEVLLQPRQAGLHHARELALFRQHPLAYAVFAFIQFGICCGHLVAHGVDHLVHERFVLPQQAAVADAASQDLAQHIPAAFVSRQHAIADEEGSRSRVIRDDAQRGVPHQISGAAAYVCQSRRALDERDKQICFEV